MCISTPKVEQPSQPPTMQTVNNENDMVASKAADVRRRRQMLSRMDTRGNGAMQGSQAQAGKTKLGQ
jgi:hypothetical protein